ncbi:hypothetical protein C8Q77DRAFT_1153251 [Trametes polyzona]|nr:hypothetical protein C8Q77DRAFT_1153251 [Trametes polyzona]
MAPGHRLAELVRAKDAQIAELKKLLATFEATPLIHRAHTPANSSLEIATAGVTRRGHIPTSLSPNASAPPAGTLEQPIELDDSDDDYQVHETAGKSTAASVLPKGGSSRVLYTDVIALSDSDSEGVNCSILDSAMKREECVAFSTTSRRKQRKLNHAASTDTVDNKSCLPTHRKDVLKKDEPEERALRLLDKSITIEPASEEKPVLPDYSADAEEEMPRVRPKDEDVLVALEDIEIRAAVTSLVNPKAEVKKEFLKEDDLVDLHRANRNALQPYPISFSPELQSVTVSREQLSKHYGGSPQDTFPRPNARKLAEHGRNNFMCINLLWNPHGPQRPGYGGLFFNTLFVKIKTGQWQYLGQYEAHPAPSLTPAQWCGLPEAVRAVWTKNTHKADWGIKTRARVHLRRTLGRAPTHEEVMAAEGTFKHITEEHINDAFVAGHECVRAWSLKCVGYDEDFQRELVRVSRGNL